MTRARPRLPGMPLWGAAAALALSASILAAAPASAAPGEADHLPDFSACTGPALEPHGFADTRGDSAEAAVDCLVHYGITKGKGPSSFAPEETVTRLQMALFLTRAARPAGISLPDSTVDQGFEDLGGLTEEMRGAANSMAELEIITGASGRRFDPQGLVTRRDMAVFLARFLELAEVGEGGTAIRTVASDENLFRDVSGLPRAVEAAVYRLYELGVTKGASDTAFAPAAPVTRGQMASFITRALAHTNARPSGVTVQGPAGRVVEGGEADILVSLRDRFHRPIRDRYIDVFSMDPGAEDPFDRDGSCSTRIENRRPLLGSSTCVIDVSDLLTDPFGNAVDSIRVDSGLVLWAWTGDIDDEFDEDRAEARAFAIRTSKAPTALEITDDMKEGAELLAFDSSITYTLQLVDRDGDPAPEARTVRVSWIIEVDGVVREQESRNYRTDESGRLAFTFRESDPDRFDADDVVTLDFDVPSFDLAVRDETTAGGSSSPGGDFRTTVNWSEEARAPTRLQLIQDPLFHVASDRDRGAVNSVQALLTDQYGDPVRGRRILFSSQDELGLGEDRLQRHTSSRGIATARYQRDSEHSGVEEIYAEVVGADPAIEADPVAHYWVEPFQAGPRRGVYILEADYDRNLFVSGDLRLYAYDRNDRFRINGAPATLSEFEAAVEERRLSTVDVDIGSLDASSVNRFDLRA